MNEYINIDQAFNPEARHAQDEFNAYLATRPMEDEQGMVHNPENGQFMSRAGVDDYFDARRQAVVAEDLIQDDYQNMGMVELARYIGEAELAGDRTMVGDLNDVLLDKMIAHAEKAGLSNDAQTALTNRLLKAKDEYLEDQVIAAQQRDDDAKTPADSKSGQQHVVSPAATEDEKRAKPYDDDEVIDAEILDKADDSLENTGSDGSAETSPKTDKQSRKDELNQELEAAIAKANQANVDNDTKTFFDAVAEAKQTLAELGDVSGNWDDEWRDQVNEELDRRLGIAKDKEQDDARPATADVPVQPGAPEVFDRAGFDAELERLTAEARLAKLQYGKVARGRYSQAMVAIGTLTFNAYESGLIDEDVFGQITLAAAEKIGRPPKGRERLGALFAQARGAEPEAPVQPGPANDNRGAEDQNGARVEGKGKFRHKAIVIGVIGATAIALLWAGGDDKEATTPSPTTTIEESASTSTLPESSTTSTIDVETANGVLTLESGGTVWDMARQQLVEQGNDSPTDAEIDTLKDWILYENGLSEEQAEDLRPGTQLKTRA